MEITDVTNDQNKKLVSVDVTINFFFVVCHVNNFRSEERRVGKEC